MDTLLANISTPVDARQSFFSTMAALQADFRNAGNEHDIRRREDALKSALDTMQAAMQGGVGKSVLADGHKLAAIVDDFNGKLGQIWDDWHKRLVTYDRNMKFRQGFTDSLVVFVLGKVKAGKSSLGNYVAYGTSTPQKPFPASKAAFFTAAMAGGAESGTENGTEQAKGRGGHFAVGARETTRTIQGFRVPGLTWVDAPGLHSVTRENGALASDYVDVADVIIYPTASDSPGRADDIKEINDLLKSKKRFLVLITQADSVEQDENENGNVFTTLAMKSDNVLASQVSWVRGNIENSADVPVPDIRVVSVRYAETQGNTPQALAASGMAGFFELLSEIFRAEGVAQKKQTPSRILNEFVNCVLSGNGAAAPSIKELNKELLGLGKKLETAKADLKKNEVNTSLRINKRIGPMVEEQINRHADDKNSDGFALACYRYLREIVKDEVTAEVAKIVARRGQKMIAMPKIDIPADLPAFTDEYVKVAKSNRGTTGAVGGGLGGVGGAYAGAAAGAALGSAVPVVGNIIGGIVGGLLGTFFGTAAGAGIGQAAGSDWEESIKSGDNREMVAQAATRALRRDADKAISQFFAKIVATAIDSPRTRQQSLTEALGRFKTTLENEVRSHD